MAALLGRPGGRPLGGGGIDTMLVSAAGAALLAGSCMTAALHDTLLARVWCSVMAMKGLMISTRLGDFTVKELESGAHTTPVCSAI